MRRRTYRWAGLALWLWAAGAAAALSAPWHGLTLRDHRAQPADAASFGGRPLLLHFVYTGCSSTCPVQLRELAQLHAELPAAVRSSVRFVSVSIDPEHDTPQTLAEFARRMGADRPGWRFVTGEARQVQRLAERLQAFDARLGTRPEDHRTSLYLFGADGQLVQRYRGVPVDRARLADELTRIARPAPATAS